MTDTKQQKMALRRNRTARYVRLLYPAGTRVTSGIMEGEVLRHVPGLNAQGGHLVVRWDNGVTGRITPAGLTSHGGGRVDGKTAADLGWRR